MCPGMRAQTKPYCRLLSNMKERLIQDLQIETAEKGLKAGVKSTYWQETRLLLVMRCSGERGEKWVRELF